jgi:hypothetical protein
MLEFAGICLFPASIVLFGSTLSNVTNAQNALSFLSKCIIAMRFESGSVMSKSFATGQIHN